MSIRQFSGDYIAMANSTLQLAGWDTFYPSGQVEPYTSNKSVTPDQFFYEGDWLGIRAIEDTWLYAEGSSDNHSLNKSSFDTLKDTHRWDSSKAQIMISAGDIVHGRFNKVKVIEGHAMGIRTAKSESPSYNIEPNSDGYYNPEDFPGCIARYDFGGLVNNTSNDYGSVSSNQVRVVNNLTTWRSSDNAYLGSLVNSATRDTTLTSGEGPDIATTAFGGGINGKTVADFNYAAREGLTLQWVDGVNGSVRWHLNYEGSPLTFVLVMRTNRLHPTAGDIGSYLIHSDYGISSAQAGNFGIGQWTHASNAFRKDYGMFTDEASATISDNSTVNLNTFEVHMFQVWDQNDNTGNFYQGRCTIFPDVWALNDSNVMVRNLPVYASSGGRTGDDIKGLNIGFGTATLNWDTFGSADANYTGIDTEDFFDGAIAEILIYNKPLCTFERKEIMNYLNNKWGI